MHQLLLRLAGYAVHDPQCPARPVPWTARSGEKNRKCNCGLDDLFIEFRE
jgi:hypothetical protein